MFEDLWLRKGISSRAEETAEDVKCSLKLNVMFKLLAYTPAATLVCCWEMLKKDRASWARRLVRTKFSTPR